MQVVLGVLFLFLMGVGVAASTSVGITQDSLGRVGIGTKWPGRTLDLRGTSVVYTPTDIDSDYKDFLPHTRYTYLSSKRPYGYVKGEDHIVKLQPGAVVGSSSKKRYIQALFASNQVYGELFGTSYGVFGLSYARGGGVVHGDSVSVYGQGAIASDGYVKGNLVGVFGNVSQSGGQVDGGRWAGYFNGPTYMKERVSIGTTVQDSEHALLVNGKIKAKDIVVDQESWADDVFDEGYELMLLSDVETFVKRYGHLPGVPTEEEVKRDGVSLGEMQVVLLRKIEELMLHIIALEKRIEGLN